MEKHVLTKQISKGIGQKIVKIRIRSFEFGYWIWWEEYKTKNTFKSFRVGLKVSKSQKENTKFSHAPKNQQNFVHFFALASKSGWIKKVKALLC